MTPSIWQVYYVRNCHQTTPPKNKYVIIVGFDEVGLSLLSSLKSRNAWLT